MGNEILVRHCYWTRDINDNERNNHRNNCQSNCCLQNNCEFTERNKKCAAHVEDHDGNMYLVSTCINCNSSNPKNSIHPGFVKDHSKRKYFNVSLDYLTNLNNKSPEWDFYYRKIGKESTEALWDYFYSK